MAVKYKQRVQTYLTPIQVKELDKQAEEEGVSRSKVIRRAVTNELGLKEDDVSENN